MRKIVFASLILQLLWTGLCSAATSADTDQMTTYAVIIGRASACGIDTGNASERVGTWMDRTFTGSERGQMLKIFMMGMEREARAQKEGRSPDSCSAVRRTLNGFPWP